MGIFDGQVEPAGDLTGVGQSEAGLSGSPNQDFVESEPVLFQDINAFSITERLGGQLAAVVAQKVFLKYGGHV